MNTNTKGEIAKLKVELRAAEKGWISSRTIEGARYDLVLDDGSKLFKVQVKWTSVVSAHSSGAVQVSLRQNNGDDRNLIYRRRKTRTYNRDEVDAVVVYISQIDKLCWFDPEVFENKDVLNIRYEPTKNGQIKNVMFAENYFW